MGLSGLCSNPLEAQLPFWLWPMSSPLSVLAQASLNCICYVKPKEPWLSEGAGTEREATPGGVHMGMPTQGGPITQACQNQTCIQVIFADDKTE